MSNEDLKKGDHVFRACEGFREGFVVNAAEVVSVGAKLVTLKPVDPTAHNVGMAFGYSSKHARDGHFPRSRAAALLRFALERDNEADDLEQRAERLRAIAEKARAAAKEQP